MIWEFFLGLETYLEKLRDEKWKEFDNQGFLWIVVG
jgi:hypothetical protein